MRSSGCVHMVYSVRPERAVRKTARFGHLCPFFSPGSRGPARLAGARARPAGGILRRSARVWAARWSVFVPAGSPAGIGLAVMSRDAIDSGHCNTSPLPGRKTGQALAGCRARIRVAATSRGVIPQVPDVPDHWLGRGGRSCTHGLVMYLSSTRRVPGADDVPKSSIAIADTVANPAPRPTRPQIKSRLVLFRIDAFCLRLYGSACGDV